MPFKDPEARKLYQHKYHEEHKEEINTRKNTRRQTEEYKEQLKQYLMDNKDKLDAKNKERFICGWGVATHGTTKQHMKRQKCI